MRCQRQAAQSVDAAKTNGLYAYDAVDNLTNVDYTQAAQIARSPA
jgi:hypothetical protein